MEANEVLEAVLPMFGRKQSDTRFVSEFYRQITNAQRTLCSKRAGRWGFLLEVDATEDTTDGTRTVNLATTFGQLFSDWCVRDTTNDTQLERITKAQFEDRWYEDGSSTDNPSKFWIWDTTMYLTPVPGGTYTIQYTYFKRPSKVTANSPTLVVPDHYMELLTLMVQKRMMRIGAWSVPDMVVEDSEIRALLKDAVQDDTVRYAELRNGLPRGARTLRHG
jgi:hypothetical protein